MVRDKPYDRRNHLACRQRSMAYARQGHQGRRYQSGQRTGCSVGLQADRKVAEPTMSIEQAIHDADAQYADAFNRGDLAARAAHHTEDVR